MLNMTRKRSNIEYDNNKIADEFSRSVKIKEYHKRNSWLILVSKLDSNKNLITCGIDNNLATIRNHDQGNIADNSMTSNNKNKTSISAKMSALITSKDPNSSSKKNTRNEEQKASENTKHRVQNISERNKVMTTHKGSIESGGTGAEQLGESFIPPQMFDNSAILFSNSKRVKSNRENMQNHIEGESNKCDSGKSIDKQVKTNKYEGEGEDDAEGESYSSSCSCSSCLREKNADNGLSLKLSQYSYKPNNSGYQQNIREGNESCTDQNSGYDEETS